MSGAVDPLYVLARTALLDALEALGPQRDAVILVGAQAIYLHTGSVDLAVPEYTTDADVVIAIAQEVTQESLASLRTRFGGAQGVGSQMAVRAAGPLADADAVADSCAALTMDLLQAVLG